MAKRRKKKKNIGKKISIVMGIIALIAALFFGKEVRLRDL